MSEREKLTNEKHQIEATIAEEEDAIAKIDALILVHKSELDNKMPTTRNNDWYNKARAARIFKERNLKLLQRRLNNVKFNISELKKRELADAEPENNRVFLEKLKLYFGETMWKTIIENMKKEGFINGKED